MNFLAHLYLTDDTPEGMVGSLLPDLVRGADRRDIAPALLPAVRLHRKIDALTDSHPVFACSTQRLRPKHGRYAPIITDVLYDHFLSIDWPRYCDEPLDSFIARVHRTFAANPHLMPGAMRSVVQRLDEQNWLGSYAHIDGVRLTLERMSARLSCRFERQVDLTPAVDELVGSHGEFRREFHAFFPDVIASCGATTNRRRAAMS